MTEIRESYDVSAATLAVEHDKEKRARHAKQEIEAVLARLRCTLQAAPAITAEGRVVAMVQIVAQ